MQLDHCRGLLAIVPRVSAIGLVSDLAERRGSNTEPDHHAVGDLSRFRQIVGCTVETSSKARLSAARPPRRRVMVHQLRTIERALDGIAQRGIAARVGSPGGSASSTTPMLVSNLSISVSKWF